MQNYHSNLLDQIKPKIYFIRGYRVMLDTDLAILYGVETKTLNQAVSRNLGRFPNDFAFQLTENEEKNLKSPLENQIVHGCFPNFLFYGSYFLVRSA